MRQQLPFVPDEQPQQLELGRSQRDRLASKRHQPLLDVDHELAEVDYRVAWWSRAPQCSSEAGQELVDPERLRHVVVRTGVECQDLLVLVADGGEDEDGRIGPGDAARGKRRSRCRRVGRDRG